MVLSTGQFHQKGGADVPVLDGGTDASTDSGARTNLGVTVYDQTTHDALDHTGLTGVGTAEFTVLDNSSNFSAINTALSNFDIVYLRPGTYSFTFATMNVPAGKSLIGLSGNQDEDSTTGAPVLQPTSQSSTNLITVFPKGTVKNLRINGISGGPANGNSSAVGASTTGQAIWLENIHVRSWGFVGSVSSQAFTVNRGRFIHCTSLLSLGDGFHINSTNGTQHGTIFEGCGAFASTLDGFDLLGGALGVTLINCAAEQNSQSGFRASGTSLTFVHMRGCRAISNGLHGFNWSGSTPSDGNYLHACYALSNGAFGYNLATTSGNLRSHYHNCTGRANTSGLRTGGGGWSIHAETGAT